MEPQPIRGRGASHNPANRFDPIEVVRDGWVDPDDPLPQTQLFRDWSRSAIARNESPDVGFETSLNPYRGCEHGCLYYQYKHVRPLCQGAAGLDFETKIFVKQDAPELLRAELSSPRWEPQTLVMSGVTDPYQPAERRLRITRRCLEVLLEFRNPVAVITKSFLVTRDADLLAELARDEAASVTLSITTLETELQRRMEPRTATPARRLEAIARLAEAGIPVGVNVAPVIPGLTDHEIPSILQEAAAAGATQAGYIMLRLPYGVAPLFERWLEQHFPDRKEKVLNRVRSLRGGRLNDPRFRARQRGEGPFAVQVARLFELAAAKAGLSARGRSLSTTAFRRPEGVLQLPLFD